MNKLKREIEKILKNTHCEGLTEGCDYGKEPHWSTDDAEVLITELFSKEIERVIGEDEEGQTMSGLLEERNKLRAEQRKGLE